MIGSVAALALLAAAASVRAAPLPDVTYADGRVTAHFDRVPLDEAIAALAREAGVEVRGELLAPREVSARFEGTRFRDALHRLLGDQNFTVSYDAAGRPQRVVLWGMRRLRTAARGGASTEGLASILARQPPAVLPPVLAGALRAPRAPVLHALRRGARHPDAAVRAAAIAFFLQTLASNRELNAALVRTDDRSLLSLLRGWVGSGTEAVLSGMAVNASDPLLRSRARRLLPQVRSGVAGSGSKAGP